MLGGSLVASVGCLVLCAGAPSAAPHAAPATDAAAAPALLLAQAGGIKGSDPETADKGQGNTGWVQAPTPRGRNAPEQAAQGAGAKPANAGDQGKPGSSGGQAPAGENPATPMTAPPLPGPSGTAPNAPSR